MPSYLNTVILIGIRITEQKRRKKLLRKISYRTVFLVLAGFRNSRPGLLATSYEPCRNQGHIICLPRAFQSFFRPSPQMSSWFQLDLFQKTCDVIGRTEAPTLALPRKILRTILLTPCIHPSILLRSCSPKHVSECHPLARLAWLEAGSPSHRQVNFLLVPSS